MEMGAFFEVSNDPVYNSMLAFGLGYCLVALIGCLFFNAAYGKFSDARFGIELGEWA